MGGLGGWGDLWVGQEWDLLKFVSMLHFHQTIPKKYLVGGTLLCWPFLVKGVQ